MSVIYLLVLACFRQTKGRVTFYPKQFLRVSYIWWWYFTKCHSYFKSPVSGTSLLHYFFLPTYNWESNIFLVKFLKWRFLWIYSLSGLLNTKTTFLAVGLCGCVSVCLLLVWLKTNCSRNYKFDILHLYFILYVDNTWNFSWRLDKISVYRGT